MAWHAFMKVAWSSTVAMFTDSSTAACVSRRRDKTMLACPRVFGSKSVLRSMMRLAHASDGRIQGVHAFLQIGPTTSTGVKHARKAVSNDFAKRTRLRTRAAGDEVAKQDDQQGAIARCAPAGRRCPQMLPGAENGNHLSAPFRWAEDAGFEVDGAGRREEPALRPRRQGRRGRTVHVADADGGSGRRYGTGGGGAPATEQSPRRTHNPSAPARRTSVAFP